jgi:hypothetical protein
MSLFNFTEYMKSKISSSSWYNTGLPSSWTLFVKPTGRRLPDGVNVVVVGGSQVAAAAGADRLRTQRLSEIEETRHVSGTQIEDKLQRRLDSPEAATGRIDGGRDMDKKCTDVSRQLKVGREEIGLGLLQQQIRDPG